MMFYGALCTSNSLVTKLSCASVSTVYFHALGMTRAKNFWFESVTCLQSNPLMCRKRSASCLGVFLFDRCLKMHLPKRSVFCIYRSACNLTSVSSFGMASGVSVTLVISGVTVSVLGVRSSVMLCCAVLLLLWNAGPSWLVAVSI